MAEPLTHAGGVVTRSHNGQTQVLLVRARRWPHDWVLPKGHIEHAEIPEQTARREVQEEAGVEAEAVKYLAQIDYEIAGIAVRAAYFLMRFVRDAEAAEDREIRWFTIDEATTRVRFDSTRQVIRQALELE